MILDKQNRKELIQNYKERKIIGGIYCIKNTENGKILLQATVDLQGGLNRYEFAIKTGSCVSVFLQKDWAVYGKDVFVVEVLDRLEKKEEQTQKEFLQDIKDLGQLWKEKFDKEQLY